jgi:hypothetical protein
MSPPVAARILVDNRKRVSLADFSGISWIAEHIKLYWIAPEKGAHVGFNQYEDLSQRFSVS